MSIEIIIGIFTLTFSLSIAGITYILTEIKISLNRIAIVLEKIQENGDQS